MELLIAQGIFYLNSKLSKETNMKKLLDLKGASILDKETQKKVTGGRRGKPNCNDSSDCAPGMCCHVLTYRCMNIEAAICF